MKISDIDVSLSQGNYLDKKQSFVLNFGIVVSLIFPILTLLLLIIPGVKWDSQMIFAMVGGNILFLSLLAVSIYIKVKNSRLRKKIIVWLEDAIEMAAYSKNIGEYLSGLGYATKIQVKFMIADKTYIKESAAKTFGGRDGYLGTFTKYADKKIKILYSPKYDEVLILKDKGN